MKRQTQQRGVVLITSLLLLVVVTVLAVSSIRLGTVNLRIVDNMQSKQVTQSIAQQASNEVLSDMGYFNDPTTTPTITIDNIDVAISQRTCVDARPAKGYSAVVPLAPEDTTWEYTTTVSASEGVNGATATIGSGVEIRMTAGSCP